ncbi:MAG TPA: type III glutamate--ammonia ligase [Steroidobacteraceae bacterium]|jgi:glutamine synthetase|nr:type III glutamate--ammonia ligase [Steroidobacteraceae bacterium]
MTPEQAKQWFEEHKSRYVLAQFVDIHGAAKAKAVPVEHYDMVITDGAGFAGFAVWGLGMGPHGPDFMGVGDPATICDVPWMPGFARMACDGHVRGQPYAYCSRVTLKRALARLAERGYTLYSGIEPEFMLLRRNEQGQLAPFDATDNADKPCYDYKGLSRASGILDDLSRHLRAVGIDVYQIDHEDANGQFEINFTYADALKSADNMIFFKMAASEIARQHGAIATFMPKPFSNRTGTGSHFHLSIGTKSEKNAFYDQGDKRGMGLSQLGYWFLGGLLEHAPALTAICAPTVNSYKRLVVGRALSGATWAPAYIAYGDNNRTACVRVPYGRIEFRLPDGAANPYLATAALAAAGLDGIDRKLDPGEPLNINLYDLSPEEIKARGIGLLPQSLSAAIDALAADKVVQQGIGLELADEFMRLKRMEWIEYSRHVGDWETQRYLEMF